MWNEFECPACFETPPQLEEIVNGAIITFPVLDITEEDGPIWNPEYMNVHEAWTARWQCTHCGYVLKDPETQEAITEHEDLIAWLKCYEAGEVPEI